MLGLLKKLFTGTSQEAKTTPAVVPPTSTVEITAPVVEAVKEPVKEFAPKPRVKPAAAKKPAADKKPAAKAKPSRSKKKSS